MGVGIDMISVWEVGVDFDFSVDRNLLGFCGGVEKFFFSVWIEINSAFVSGHLNGLDIRVAIEIDLISVTGSVFMYGSK